MINQEELVICRRRGHAFSFMNAVWRQCKACGMWVREVITTEEREDTPPAKERNLLFELQRKIGKVRLDRIRIHPEEREICKRRGHATLPDETGWIPCSACGTWLRERRTIEETEDEPADN